MYTETYTLIYYQHIIIECMQTGFCDSWYIYTHRHKHVTSKQWVHTHTHNINVTSTIAHTDSRQWDQSLQLPYKAVVS